MAKRLRGADKCALIVRGSLARRQVSRRAGDLGLRPSLDDIFALQVCGQAVHEAGSNDGVALELDGQAAQEIVALVRMNRRRRLHTGHRHGAYPRRAIRPTMAPRRLRLQESGSQGKPSSAAVNPGMYMSGYWTIGNGGALSPERL